MGEINGIRYNDDLIEEIQKDKIYGDEDYKEGSKYKIKIDHGDRFDALVVEVEKDYIKIVKTRFI